MEALRTLMAQISGVGDKMASLADEVVQLIIPSLVEQIESPIEGLQTNALDVLNDVLVYAGTFVSSHAPLEQAVADILLSKLSSGRASLVRRGIQGLSFLSQVCRIHTYDAILERGLAGLQPPFLSEAVAVQLLGVLARETPQRLRPHKTKYTHGLISALERANQKEEADEFRESCLVSLQSLARMAGAEPECMKGALETALSMLQYDPNAMDAMDEDDIGDDLELDDDDMLDTFSDDDDLSWRVRRAASRLLGTLFEENPQEMVPSASRVTAALVERLKEREETVRLEALGALKSVLIAAPEAFRSHTSIVEALCTWRGAAAQVAALDALEKFVSSFGMALSQGENALNLALCAVEDETKTHSKGRCIAGLALLRQLCVCVPTVVLPHAVRVTTALAESSQLSHHHTALEGLEASTQFLWHVGPRVPQQAELLCDAVCTRLERSDTDASVRDAALVALDAALCSTGAQLTDRLPRALALIYARLTHEVTRARCVQVVHDVMTCRSLQTCAPTKDFARQCLAPLSDLARQRDTATSSLRALHSVAVLLQNEAQPTLLNILSRELPAVNSPMLPPTLELAELAVQCDPSVAHIVVDNVLPGLLKQLSDVPPPALEALHSLLTSLASAEDSLAPALVTALEHAWELHCSDRAAQVPLVYAQCLGAAAAASDSISTVLARVQALLKEQSTTAQTLALYALGVLGQKSLLTGWPHAQHVFKTVLNLHLHGRAFALGGMILSNASFASPVIEKLAGGEADAARILCEALSLASETQTRDLAPMMWPYLQSAILAGHAPDACAECIARIVVVDTKRLGELAQLVQAPQVPMRVMGLVAVRTLLSLDRQNAADDEMNKYSGKFFERLGDPELPVRRAAMMVLHAAVNSRTTLMLKHASLVLPFLYDATVVREDLKRKVLMGPFTVVQDDGLDLRKNALETLFTFVDTCIDCLQLRDVMDCVLRALSDDDSVKLLGCLMLMRLADLEYMDLTPYLDAITPKLQAILTRKVRDNATKQEVEKASEITHAVLRVLTRLAPLAPLSPSFTELLAQTRASPHGEAWLRLMADRSTEGARP